MYRIFKKNKFFDSDQYSDKEVLPISITDLVENRENFVVLLVNPSEPKPLFKGSNKMVLKEFPFMVQYWYDGDLYGRRTLIQDPFNGIGPYVLDRTTNSDNKSFLREPFDRLDKTVRRFSGLLGNHDIVHFPSFHYVGDSKYAIDELKDEGYEFKDWNIPKLFERFLKKITV